MLPEVKYLKSLALPPGWLSPSQDLMQFYVRCRSEGIASTSAPQIHRPSQVIPVDRLASVEAEIAMLGAYVDTSSPSQLGALGMAYPQLAIAQNESWRIFTACLGMTGLLAENVRSSWDTFVNPVVTPVKSKGQDEDIEYCYSVPGLTTTVVRWKAVDISALGREPQRIHGPSARIIQHELDHLDGKLCVQVGMAQGSQLYYVPPELKKVFLNLYLGGRIEEWPLRYPMEQWQALVRGDFSLDAYVPFL